jgi:hypothetical protein
MSRKKFSIRITKFIGVPSADLLSRSKVDKLKNSSSMPLGDRDFRYSLI